MAVIPAVITNATYVSVTTAGAIDRRCRITWTSETVFSTKQWTTVGLEKDHRIFKYYVNRDLQGQCTNAKLSVVSSIVCHEIASLHNRHYRGSSLEFAAQCAWRAGYDVVMHIFVADRLLANYPSSSTLEASSMLQGQVLKRLKPMLKHSTGFLIMLVINTHSLRHRQTTPPPPLETFCRQWPAFFAIWHLNILISQKYVRNATTDLPFSVDTHRIRCQIASCTVE